ncbi:hypothetical protein MLD38_031717 [Melastoma candidum]|uniref:Uncharacterized protein n=1 Tax=Melastoma candidum TaxID=119954 RepID=A0ACB9MRR0_9MYRT|nr:hypothetical protein MLD38_031717 [Melastoma candidum]
MTSSSTPFLPLRLSIVSPPASKLSRFVPSPELRIRSPSYVAWTRRRPFVVVAAQSNFLRVIQTVWKVGRDGIEAGMDLVPDSVPRPVARIGVAVVALSLTLFVLKSFLSTALFVLATMGLIYFTYIALNKDGGSSRKGGGTAPKMDDPVDEARKIMEKYK